MIKKVFIFICFLSLSCSSLDLKVESEPSQADVYLVEAGTKKKIGTTPFEADIDKLSESSQHHLMVSKPGYASHSFLFESRSLPGRGRVFVELNPSSQIGADPSTEGFSLGNFNYELDRVSRRVAAIQSELLRRNFVSAEILAKELVNENPRLAVGWSLLGNTYYLQQRSSAALQAYRKALEYDPQNRETKIMIRKISSVEGEE